FLPSTIAAYSVIGEREQGTLEPILTTPATDGELLLGKAVAPVIPAIGLSWLLYMGYLAFAVALLAPTLAGYSTILGLLFSARSSDVRVGLQLSVLSPVPLLAVVAI